MRKFLGVLGIVLYVTGCQSDGLTLQDREVFNRVFPPVEIPVICVVRSNALTYGIRSIVFQDNNQFFGMLERNEYLCRKASYGKHIFSDDLTNQTFTLEIQAPLYYFVYFTTSDNRWKPSYQIITSYRMNLLLPKLTERKLTEVEQQIHF